MKSKLTFIATALALLGLADIANAQLPDPGVEIIGGRTTLLILEQGLEFAVVSDATAAAIVEESSGYESTLVNFRFIANTVWTTEEAVQKIKDSK